MEMLSSTSARLVGIRQRVEMLSSRCRTDVPFVPVRELSLRAYRFAPLGSLVTRQQSLLPVVLLDDLAAGTGA